MTRQHALLAVMLAVTSTACTSWFGGAAQDAQTAQPWGIVIHTGAGNFTLASLGDRHAPMRAAMAEALMAGYARLSAGGSSIDAVEAAIGILEDSPHFNAGKGSVFTHESVSSTGHAYTAFASSASAVSSR